jgi:cyclopropane fatty-acyl-phospholipid synthase-like methyltransferase
MKKLTAKTADKHKLYEKSVQCVEADIDFVEKTFKQNFKRKPRLLKEDFCGTMLASAEFVSRSQKNSAVAVDLDKKVLKWGKKNNLAKLGSDAVRVKVENKNVLDLATPKVDVVLALNFSYFIFKTRRELITYFKAARSSIKKEGQLILDVYGGSDAQVTMEEPRKQKGFTYIWDQAEYNPITSDVVNYIHFKFPDGSMLRKAFVYEWRLWTVREITDALIDAGFSTADVYWEGWDDETDEGDGNFKKTVKAENSPGWIAYIVAKK